jgi:hypothetical protein
MASLSEFPLIFIKKSKQFVKKQAKLFQNKPDQAYFRRSVRIFLLFTHLNVYLICPLKSACSVTDRRSVRFILL